MIERSFFDGYEPASDRTDVSDDEPARLRDAVAYWTETTEEESRSEEEQLAAFLEALDQAEHQIHNAADEGGENMVGRRGAARLRLSLPAHFVSVERTQPCILLNISQTGAKIAILDPIREGDGGILKCGKLSAFAIVARSEFSLNALQFEHPITHEDVLAMRRHYETFEDRERRKLIETARKWASGESDDERAM
ncbi:MAG: hypothetical protein AAGH57_12785 [Pseudomonadota bacterium]